MIRLFTGTMKWCGLAGMLIAVAWLTATGMNHVPPEPLIPDKPYVAEPSSGVFHDPDRHCIYLDTSKPLLKLPNRKQAEDFGAACTHCVTRAMRTASRQPPSQTPAGTALRQIRSDAH